MNLTVMHKNQAVDHFTAIDAEAARKYVLARFGEVLTVVDNDNKVIVRPYNFELKNVKYAAFNSTDSHCFEATLYKNGKRWCIVSDDGNGGRINFNALEVKPGCQSDIYKQVSEVNAVLANEIIPSEYFEDGLKNDLEIEVGGLMNRWHRVQEVKKLTRKICYIKGGDTKVIYELPAKFKPTKVALAQVKNSKWFADDYKLVNEMSVDQILALDWFGDAA